MEKLLFALIVLGFSGLALAEAMPPLGKRIYILGDSNAPTEISAEHDKPSGKKTMKDPIPFGSKVVIPIEPASSLVSPDEKPAEVTFKKVAIKGRYLVPRVSIQRPILEVPKAEEPIRVNYRQKVKESETLLKDFEW